VFRPADHEVRRARPAAGARLPLSKELDMKKTLIAFALLLAVSACGGGERPTTGEVAAALKDKDNDVAAQLTSAFGELLDDDTVDCIAKVLHDSPVSDDALQAIVDGDTDYKGSDKDADALKDASDGIAHCITG
jgi:hypothetical protein